MAVGYDGAEGYRVPCGWLCLFCWFCRLPCAGLCVTFSLFLLLVDDFGGNDLD